MPPSDMETTYAYPLSGDAEYVERRASISGVGENQDGSVKTQTSRTSAPIPQGVKNVKTEVLHTHCYSLETR